MKLKLPQMSFAEHYAKITLYSTFLAIAGCTTPVTPDFSEMSATYAGILEQYQINSILMNVVRASQQRPLSFLDMPNINGSGNVNVSPSVSGSFSGISVMNIAGGLSSLSPSLSTSFGNSFNFTQSSLDNATFWKGFLSEIPIDTVKYFGKNHFPREVMFSLMVDSIQIKKSDGTITTYVNNPLQPGHEEFQKQIYRLLKYGLMVDVVNETPLHTSSKGVNNQYYPPSSYGGSNQGAGYGSQGGMYGSQGGMYGQYGGGMYGDQYSSFQPRIKYHFCVEENENVNVVKEEFSDNIFCKPPKTIVGNAGSRKAELIIAMRSPRNVFDFLGQVVSAQLKKDPYIVTLPPTRGTFNNKDGESNRYALLVVKKNESQNQPFAKVKSLDGNIYAIPGDNNGYSPLVVDLMSQILTLSKVPGSIPPSPGILIR